MAITVIVDRKVRRAPFLPRPKARGWSSFDFGRFFRNDGRFRGALEKVSQSSIVTCHGGPRGWRKTFKKTRKP